MELALTKAETLKTSTSRSENRDSRWKLHQPARELQLLLGSPLLLTSTISRIPPATCGPPDGFPSRHFLQFNMTFYLP